MIKVQNAICVTDFIIAILHFANNIEIESLFL